MRSRAAAHCGAIVPGRLGAEDLGLYLRHLGTAEAVTAYAASAQPGAERGDIERYLADQLVVHRCWDALASLDGKTGLQRDAACVMSSLDAMDDGAWSRASDLLRNLPEHSPYAAWPVFCTAMASFAAGDDEGLGRALDSLPGDFVLAGTVAELRRVAGRGTGNATARIQAALGTDSEILAGLGRNLLTALASDGRPRTIANLTGRLADSLCPDDPLPALVDLIHIAGMAIVRHGLSRHTVEELARMVLPSQRLPGVVARVSLALQHAGMADWNPVAAATLLSRVSTEFPEPADQALVRGLVLGELARTGHRQRRIPPVSPEIRRAVSQLLGGRPVRQFTLYADLMEASLAADPDNRDGYWFLLTLIASDRKGRERKQAVLERMAARFPEDAEPYIELTRLHYSRNAYRRAENSLAEARRRAPHDERILDMQSAGFLNSADRSRNRGRFELAARDIEHAAVLKRARLADIVTAKRILLEVVSTGRDADAVVTPHLDQFPPAGQIRILTLLIHDLDLNSHVRNVVPAMAVSLRALLASKAPIIDGLDTGEAAGLVAPLADDLDVLFKALHVAPVLRSLWPAILMRQDGDRLLDSFDALMACDGGTPVVRTEITRRLAGADGGERDRLLLLYLALIRYQSGHDYDSRRFREALDGASASERERLRTRAARLAHGTTGALREALVSLDFDSLDFGDPGAFDRMPDDAPDVGLKEVVDLLEGDDTLMELVNFAVSGGKDLVSPLEFLDRFKAASGNGDRQPSLFGDTGTGDLDLLDSLFDSCGYRGMPAPLFAMVSETAWQDPDIGPRLEKTARIVERAGRSIRLSRELQMLLFPGSTDSH